MGESDSGDSSGSCHCSEGSDNESCLARRMGRLMIDARTADCTVEVGGVDFPCHKCILASASPVFRTMLYEAEMREQREGHIKLDGMTEAGWAVLRSYCYHEKVRACG